MAAWLVHSRAYPSHFARHSQGTLTHVGLQNLAGQLIRSYSLHEFAPGDMLPSWVTDAGGFEALLSRAAEAAKERGEKLVIVVDGADEAERSQDGMPWSLPSLLPDGVYVVGTYRTGYAPPFPASPVESVRIEKTDERNLLDLRNYVSRVIQEESVSARLADASMGHEETVTLLTTKTGGVWVYLRYILSEMRTGQRLATALDDLPNDLSGYYAQQLRRWQENDNWEEMGKPILSTLVVAGEPLPYASLVRFSGLKDSPAVRRWCDLLIRPFLTVDHNRTYQLYHASAREFYGGNLPKGIEADHLHAMALSLMHDAREAHERIANDYLRRFGDLDTSLRLLGLDPELAQEDGGYALRNLISHLLSLGKAEQAHQLLNCRHPTIGVNCQNVWFTAHEQAGTLDAYLVDVERARKNAQQQSEAAITLHAPAGHAFVHELRCLLLTASTSSFTDSVGHKLLAELVRRGVWTVDHGISHARRLTDPEERYKGLLAVHPYALPDQQTVIAEEALSAARTAGFSIGQSMEGGVYIISPIHVIPFLPEERKSEVLNEFLSVTPEPRLEELLMLLPHFSMDERPQYTETALRLFVSKSQPSFAPLYEVHRLIELYKWCSGKEIRQELLERAIKTACDEARSDRGHSLQIVLAHVPAALHERLAQLAIDAARRGWPHTLATDLADLIPLIPSKLQLDVAMEALNAARADKEIFSRMRSLSLLLPYVPSKEREEIVEELTANIAATDHFTLARLSPFVSTADLKDLLHASQRVAWGGRLASLSKLSEYLPVDERHAHALSMIEAVETAEPRVRGAVGAAFLPSIKQAEREALVPGILDVIRKIPAESRAGHLADVIENAPEADRKELASEVHLYCMQNPDPRSWMGTFGRIASMLPEKKLAEIVNIVSPAYAFGWVLREIFPSLPSTLATKAFEALCETNDEEILSENITHVAPALPSHLIPLALDKARRLSAQALRSRALASLVPYIDDQFRHDVAKEAVTAANDCWYSRVLGKHFSEAADESPETLCKGIVTIWRSAPQHHEELLALSFMLPYLSKGRQSEIAVQVFSEVQILRELDRRQILPMLIPHLSVAWKGELVKACQGGSGKFYSRISEPVNAFLEHMHTSWDCARGEKFEIVREVFPRKSLHEALRVIIESFPVVAEMAGKEARRDLIDMITGIALCWPE